MDIINLLRRLDGYFAMEGLSRQQTIYKTVINYAEFQSYESTLKNVIPTPF